MSRPEISYSEDISPEAAYFELFETTGWNRDYQANRDEFYRVLNDSWYVLSAYDKKRLVGLGRILSDGLLHAVIFDVIVHPDYKGCGIGREIMRRLVNKCKAHKIRDIQLFCAKGKVGFYEKCGFIKRPDDGPGMEIKMKYQET